jgi:alpha-L-fucosidase
MFIHWGLYAIPARGAAVQSTERMSGEEYDVYFGEFDPTLYDPKAWAKAAKEAGQRYAVITAKNHDGFCLFDSSLTDFKATNTPAGKDLIEEFVAAFHAEDIAVGFYYSLLDWHHGDYPHFGDPKHPMREDEAYKGRKHTFSRYVDYLHGQIRELLTNYGKIDILWFDYSYGNLKGEGWRATELVRMARSVQPEIIVNNRLGGNIHVGGDFTVTNPKEYAGDFGTPEMVIPEKGIVNEDGRPLPWELCVTPNDHFSYCLGDTNFKTPREVVRILVECVSKDGNLLFDVGPNAKGEIPDESLRVLSEVGKWMNRNNESIYGCGSSELPKPSWGFYTQRGRMLYAHIFDRGSNFIRFKGMNGKVKRVRLLADGSEIRPISPVQAKRYEEDLIIKSNRRALPDDIDTVVSIELMES